MPGAYNLQMFKIYNDISYALYYYFRNDTRAFVKKAGSNVKWNTFNDKIFSKMTLRSNLICTIQIEQANNQTFYHSWYNQGVHQSVPR